MKGKSTDRCKLARSEKFPPLKAVLLVGVVKKNGVSQDKEDWQEEWIGLERVGANLHQFKDEGKVS